MPDTDQTNAQNFVTNFSKALKSASEVAVAARLQLAGYKNRVEVAAQAIEDANKTAPRPTEDERSLMAASTRAVSSLADVFIDFADAAVDELSQQSAGTRQKAMNVIRKVLKLAVDDALGEAFNGPSRAIGPLPRSVELHADASSQHIYLPTRKSKSKVSVKLANALPGVQIRLKDGTWKALTAKIISIDLAGSNPRISLRVDPTHKVTKSAVAIVQLSGAIEHSIAILVTPSVKPSR